MRRIFIIRKDLQLSAGKLAAMVAHCAEGYWTRLIARHVVGEVLGENVWRTECIDIDKDIFEQYIRGSFVKTICEAKNLNQLLKAKRMAEDMGMVEETDFGLINDRCLTELTPENEDGTTTVGVWFKPLPDEIAHQISKKYQLYK